MVIVSQRCIMGEMHPLFESCINIHILLLVDRSPLRLPAGTPVLFNMPDQYLNRIFIYFLIKQPINNALIRNNTDYTVIKIYTTRQM